MKIRLRKIPKLSLEYVLMITALLCVSTFALLEHTSISISFVSFLKTPILLLGAVCILLRIFAFLQIFRKKKYFYVMLTVFSFCLAALLLAGLLSDPPIGDPPMKDTIRLVLYLFELFTVMVWLVETERTKWYLDFLFYYVLILTALTDICLFSGIVRFSDGSFETYLVGTKFNVSYFHLNLLTLWYVRNRSRFHSDKRAKRIMLLGIPISLFVSIRIDCMTGVLGSIVLLLIFLFMDTKLPKKLMRLCSPVFLGIAMLLSVVFPFVSEKIISLPAVSYLVEEILNRNNRLTGRLNIFEIYTERLSEHWLAGYGYGNGNVASVSLFGYANAQNAILHWILQVGIPVTLLLLFLVILVFRQVSRSKNIFKAMPFVVLIYVYIILGTIETTMSMSFFLWVAVLFMIANEKNSTRTQNEALPLQQ